MYIIDPYNNNKVIDAGSDVEKRLDSLCNSIGIEWMNFSDSLEEYRKSFLIVSEQEMEKAVFKYGERKRSYWN